MFDGFRNRGKITAMSECRRASDVPELTRHESAKRNSFFGDPLVAEELVVLIAQVVPFEIGVGSNQSAAVWSGFQPRRFTLFGHVKTNRLPHRDKQLPLGVKRIRLGKHSTVELHRGDVA